MGYQLTSPSPGGANRFSPPRRGRKEREKEKKREKKTETEDEREKKSYRVPVCIHLHLGVTLSNSYMASVEVYRMGIDNTSGSDSKRMIAFH